MEENTNGYIVDASFILSLLLPDEEKPENDIYLRNYQKGKLSFITTPLLPFEVGNALVSAVKRKRIDSAQATFLFEQFCDLSLDIAEVDSAAALECAFQYNLSFYDAAYVQLAKERELPLLTYDKKLAEVAALK